MCRRSIAHHIEQLYTNTFRITIKLHHLFFDTIVRRKRKQDRFVEEAQISEMKWADNDGDCFRCYVRSENTSCRAAKCESSTEQYWKRYVLGMHKANLGIREVLVNGTMVNRSYAFPDVSDFKRHYFGH